MLEEIQTDQNVDQVIRDRKTMKVLGNPAEPFPTSAEFDAIVAELIEVSGYAPFHKEASQIHRQDGLESAVPWRFHALSGESCRALLAWLKSQDEKMMRGKIPRMLAAAGALIQVTWLPDEGDLASHKNLEHLMAASAATQNLLLAATGRGIANYWSSGGVLREDQLFETLGISTNEKLVGSIFLFPEVPEGIDVGTGSHRGKNNPVEGWARWVEL